MKLEDIVAVSGLAGLHKMVANRNNGLIVEDLDNGKRRFASSRKHQFTPLASIGIYTDEDTIELKVVFRSMLEQMESNPPIATNASAEAMKDYFSKILPEFDRDRVYPSDIKKVIKWFNFLHKRDLLDEALKEEETEGTEAEGAETTTETTEETPTAEGDNPSTEEAAEPKETEEEDQPAE
ncbi:MAG: DUF5606 domain-containing protein [Bacteroidota bacterium]